MFILHYLGQPKGMIMVVLIVLVESNSGEGFSYHDLWGKSESEQGKEFQAKIFRLDVSVEITVGRTSTCCHWWWVMTKRVCISFEKLVLVRVYVGLYESWIHCRKARFRRAKKSKQKLVLQYQIPEWFHNFNLRIGISIWFL